MLTWYWYEFNRSNISKLINFNTVHPTQESWKTSRFLTLLYLWYKGTSGPLLFTLELWTSVHGLAECEYFELSLAPTSDVAYSWHPKIIFPFFKHWYDNDMIMILIWQLMGKVTNFNVIFFAFHFIYTFWWKLILLQINDFERRLSLLLFFVYTIHVIQPCYVI